MCKRGGVGLSVNLSVSELVFLHSFKANKFYSLFFSPLKFHGNFNTPKVFDLKAVWML